MLTIVVKIKNEDDIEQIMAAGAEDLGTYFMPWCLRLNSEPESVLLKNVKDSERYSLEYEDDIWKKEEEE